MSELCYFVFFMELAHFIWVVRCIYIYSLYYFIIIFFLISRSEMLLPILFLILVIWIFSFILLGFFFFFASLARNLSILSIFSNNQLFVPLIFSTVFLFSVSSISKMVFVIYFLLFALDLFLLFSSWVLEMRARYWFESLSLF